MGTGRQGTARILLTSSSQLSIIPTPQEGLRQNLLGDRCEAALLSTPLTPQERAGLVEGRESGALHSCPVQICCVTPGKWLLSLGFGDSLLGNEASWAADPMAHALSEQHKRGRGSHQEP